jgi:hypothetical protein
VHDKAPGGKTFVAPERDVRSGRPTVGDRSNKRRSSEQPAAEVPCGDDLCSIFGLAYRDPIQFEPAKRRIRGSRQESSASDSPCLPFTQVWHLDRDDRGRYAGRFTSDPRHTHLKFGTSECWALAITVDVTLVPVFRA